MDLGCSVVNGVYFGGWRNVSVEVDGRSQVGRLEVVSLPVACSSKYLTTASLLVMVGLVNVRSRMRGVSSRFPRNEMGECLSSVVLQEPQNPPNHPHTPTPHRICKYPADGR